MHHARVFRKAATTRRAFTNEKMCRSGLLYFIVVVLRQFFVILQADMKTEKSITVYCGSAANLAPAFIESAVALGRAIACAGVTLVTGAGRTGMMGAAADAALAAGGRVRGIIPQFMVDRGWHHSGLSELIITADMHERKKLMAQSTACVALPGGIGTFEELCEIITWRQLGLFDGNIVIYNAEGYYDPLLSMFATAIEKGFMRPDHSRLFNVASSAVEAVEMALATTGNKTFTPKF